MRTMYSCDIGIFTDTPEKDCKYLNFQQISQQTGVYFLVCKYHEGRTFLYTAALKNERFPKKLKSENGF